jgi:hypothetical protein
MKRISIIYGFIILLLAGCNDFLDVNENPNFPTDVEDYLILSAAQASCANVLSADWGLIGSFWSQHWAQNNTSSQYKIFESYTFSNNTNRIDGSYSELYYGGLADNEIIHLKALEEENWGVYLMTSTLKAFMFQYLVDYYGNVPYDEAFLGETGNITPIINRGEDVYASIYDLLDAALAKDLSGFNAARYTNADLLLGAEISDWVDFANTVKLKILLRQFEANTAWATTELTSLLASGTFLSTDVALSNFQDEDSKSNPLYEADQRQLNTANNIRANATFTAYLKGNGTPAEMDNRISFLFDSLAGDILGMITGSYEVPSTSWEAPDLVCQPKLTPLMPVYLATVAEAELLLAEAHLRLGNAAFAQAHYEAGVTSSFDRMGGLSATSMIGAGGRYEYPAAGTFDQQLEAIIMQKWIDAADGQRGFESFIDWVRTGYPAESAVSNAVPEGLETDLILTPGYVLGTLVYSKKGATGGAFPVRYPYPDAELNYNANAAEYKSITAAEAMQQKVWWNQ